MKNTLLATSLQLPGHYTKYTGKVRDVYTLEEDRLVMVATDRLSAFDVVMPRGIPFKGQILNQIAYQMLQATADLVPNWLEACPDPNVSIGQACTPFKIEMVIRGYLVGHAAREYSKGRRHLCGVPLPKGMQENEAFSEPIITPATKADNGHDEDISREEILRQGIVNEADYTVLEKYTRALFQRGTELAQQQGLILVDTKYEFGRNKAGEIVLIDEIHTPDSSRYFYQKGYAERLAAGAPQKQLSKEFVRRWLISHGFQGLERQKLPPMDDAYIASISKRYIELFENITGKIFEPAPLDNIHQRIENNLLDYLQ